MTTPDPAPSSEQPFPPVRYVETTFIRHQGQDGVYVRDPMAIATSELVISPLDYFILAHLDGRHGPAAIQRNVALRANGLLVPEAHIRKLVQTLDDHFYLDNAKGRQRQRALKKEFRDADVREAWHAGLSYESDPKKLIRHLESFYRHPDGAGWPPGRNDEGGSAGSGRPRVNAALAPHIDLRVGGPCYTHAHRALAEAGGAEVYILLGVAHHGDRDFLIPCAKDFRTPLGRVATDREFMDRWAEAAGTRLPVHDWPHRTEHSIEFQLPFLQHLFADRFRIVPILCGAVEPWLARRASPVEDPAWKPLIAGLREAVRGDSRRMTVLLSVDLAHVGPKFGDPDPVTPEWARTIQQEDRTLLELAATGDREGFLDLLWSDGNRRHVDACGALLVLFELAGDLKGRILRYDQNHQRDSQSVVSFASMVFA
jgi:hypothetical protein